jgi:cytochrome b subunit of formate dehydrogenase
VRRGLHSLHAATSLLLVASGLLIEWPDLRSRLVGGYGQEIAEWHLWLGLAFAGAPLLALAVRARRLLGDLALRLGPPYPFGWKKLHIAASIALSALVTASGLVLWLDPPLPRAAWDAALWTHIVTAWAITVAIPVHLVVARRRIVQVVRVWLGLEPPVDLDALLDPPDDPGT